MTLAVRELDSAEDERLEVYRDLRTRPGSDPGRFIVEGEHLLGRLVTSEVELESVLVSTRKWPGLRPVVPVETPIYVLSDSEIEKVVGFKFHRGVLGCGIRPAERPIEEIFSSSNRPRGIIACPEISAAENLGSIIRTGRCLGVDALVLGERCTDAYSRRCIRVSMGTAFSLAIYKCNSIIDDLRRFRSTRDVQFIAAGADPGARPLVSVQPAGSWCLFLGNEENGLGKEVLEICDTRVRIPMAEGADSLNVSVAAGIILHHMTAGGIDGP